MPGLTPRTRLIFQNMDVYVGPCGLSGSSATGWMSQFGGQPSNSGNALIAQMSNVTSAQLSISLNRQDVNIFGQLQRLGSVMLAPPSINLNMSYNLKGGREESILGLNTNGGSLLSGILTKVSDSKNYFLSISQQGVDDNSVSNPNNRDVLAIGNGFISNYGIDLSVGQIPTANVSVDALNIASYTGSSGLASPAIDPVTSIPITTWTASIPPGQVITGGFPALRPGDIQLSFPTSAGFLVPLSGSNSVNIQSVSLSVPISREIINRLGSAFGFSREIQFPLSCSMQIRALQTELNTGSFSNLYCDDRTYSFKVRLMQPGCPGSTTAEAIVLNMNAAQITNVSFGNTLNGNGTVDISTSAQLAGATSLAGITFSGYEGFN